MACWTQSCSYLGHYNGCIFTMLASIFPLVSVLFHWNIIWCHFFPFLSRFQSNWFKLPFKCVQWPIILKLEYWQYWPCHDLADLMNAIFELRQNRLSTQTLSYGIVSHCSVAPKKKKQNNCRLKIYLRILFNI